MGGGVTIIEDGVELFSHFIHCLPPAVAVLIREGEEGGGRMKSEEEGAGRS